MGTHDARATNTLWGEWVRTRAAFVGLENQGQLAQLLGCSRTQLWKWFKFERPGRMNRGLDISLCHALQTDRATLFVDYFRVRPEAAPRLVPERNAEGELEMRGDIIGTVAKLTGERLRLAHKVVQTLSGPTDCGTGARVA